MTLIFKCFGFQVLSFRFASWSQQLAKYFIGATVVLRLQQMTAMKKAKLNIVIFMLRIVHSIGRHFEVDVRGHHRHHLKIMWTKQIGESLRQVQILDSSDVVVHNV